MSPEEEARRMLAIYGDLAACLAEMKESLHTIQTRTQVLLTLATVSLTITGFSGPTIAASNRFSRIALGAGLFFTMTTLVIILLASLRIHWITQMVDDDPHATLTRIIGYRNRKTTLLRSELTMLVIGLVSYVGSVLAFLVVGMD